MDNRELQSEEGSLLPEEAFDAIIDPRESSGDQDAAAEDEEVEDADVMEIEVEQVDVDDSPLRVAVGRRSRMEKDPLSIGVPFPVFRVVATEATPSPISPVARLPSTVSETSLEDDSASDKLNDRHQHVIGGNVAVGIPSQDQDAVSADVKAQLAQLDVTIKRMAAGVDAGFHGSESFGRRLSMQERCSIPGGYAIGGPGINANEQREASVTVPGEDVARRERSASLCLSTTGETLSSNYSSSNLEQSSASNILVEATLVAEENTDNLYIVHAEAKPLHRFNLSRSFLLCMALLFIFLISVVVVVTLIGQSHGHDADSMRSQERTITQAPTAETFGRPTLPDVPTLQRIKETGAVRCGKVSDVSNFLVQVGGSPPKGSTRAQSEEDFKGANAFTDNFCSAVAAAVFGNSSRYEIVLRSQEDMYKALGMDEIDLVFSRQSKNMQQDIFEKDTGEGISYSIPYLYGGFGFAGIPEFVECADEDLATSGDCTQMKICVDENNHCLDNLLVIIPQSQVLVVNSSEAMFLQFLTGNCNVIASESASMVERILRIRGYALPLSVGKRELAPLMFSVITKDSDPEWGDFVNAILMALLAAEQAGITKATAEDIGETELFGDEHVSMFIDTVKSFGNFGDLYTFPMDRLARNLVNNGTTGMLVSPPLGILEYLHPEPPGPISGGTIDSILTRGFLRCGVRGDRPGFAVFIPDNADWVGLEIDFCKALAASLFEGEFQNIEFIDITVVSETSNGFVMLHADDIDVFAGAMWTFENDMRETVTQVGYSFSEPYFYSPLNDSQFEENLCLATRQDDPQWSAFVYWASQSIIYAEEHGIVQRTSSQMPLIYFYGVGFRRMFRDAIAIVGNYDEVYQRHLARILPRGGRNRLNIQEEHGKGPMRYLPPGFPI